MDCFNPLLYIKKEEPIVVKEKVKTEVVETEIIELVEDTDADILLVVIGQRDPFPFIGRIRAFRASQRKPGILLGNHPPIVKESRKGNW